MNKTFNNSDRVTKDLGKKPREVIHLNLASGEQLPTANTSNGTLGKSTAR